MVAKLWVKIGKSRLCPVNGASFLYDSTTVITENFTNYIRKLKPHLQKPIETIGECGPWQFRLHISKNFTVQENFI